MINHGNPLAPPPLLSARHGVANAVGSQGVQNNPATALPRGSQDQIAQNPVAGSLRVSADPVSMGNFVVHVGAGRKYTGSNGARFQTLQPQQFSIPKLVADLRAPDAHKSGLARSVLGGLADTKGGDAFTQQARERATAALQQEDERRGQLQLPPVKLLRGPPAENEPGAQAQRQDQVQQGAPVRQPQDVRRQRPSVVDDVEPQIEGAPQNANPLEQQPPVYGQPQQQPMYMPHQPMYPQQPVYAQQPMYAPQQPVYAQQPQLQPVYMQQPQPVLAPPQQRQPQSHPVQQQRSSKEEQDLLIQEKDFSRQADRMKDGRLSNQPATSQELALREQAQNMREKRLELQEKRQIASAGGAPAAQADQGVPPNKPASDAPEPQQMTRAQQKAQKRADAYEHAEARYQNAKKGLKNTAKGTAAAGTAFGIGVVLALAVPGPGWIAGPIVCLVSAVFGGAPAVALPFEAAKAVYHRLSMWWNKPKEA